MRRLTKYINKPLRRDNIKRIQADELSQTINLANPTEKVEDLGFLQRNLIHPKSYSSFKNNVGFAESK